MQGEEEFGILSVYVDKHSFFEAMDEHINTSRRQSALVLLSLTMFIVFFINFFALKGAASAIPRYGK